MLPFQWKQGEHLSLAGRTGSGKTTLANVLLYAREHTLALRTKADNAPLPGKYIKTAALFSRGEHSRYVLDVHKLSAADKERELVAAIERVIKEGGWTVYADELFYLSQRVKVAAGRIEELLTQGRSNGITVITGMQRPVNVTRFALSESTHIVSFGVDGRDALKTLRELGGDKFAATVQDLGRYEFAWRYVPTNEVWRGRVQALVPNLRP